MPLLSIYNHLIQGLIMMRPNRFDTHKKSELQNVYRDIMRLTSEQPLYKVTFDAPAQEYTLGIKNATISLASTVKELNTNDNTSVFKGQILVSDQPDVVDISVLEGAVVPNDDLPLDIEVTSLSSPQENSGSFVPSSENSLLDGQYTFTIGVEENMYSFQFNVTREATNLELQKKLSDFINKTSIGVKTNIVRDTEADMSRLDLHAVASGHALDQSVSFTLEDVRYPEDASKGIISYFGLNHVASYPKNTSFSINGKSKEVRGRSYLYNNSLTLAIKSISDTPVHVAHVTDQAPIVEKVYTLVNKYNDIFTFVNEKQPNNHRSKKLLYDLGNTMRRFSSTLAKCGITVSHDGTLSVDEERLPAAASDGSLEKLFSPEEELSTALLKRLSDISLNPLEYLQKTVVTYPNLNARKTVNPYISSIYCGLLYNNYC